MTNEISGGRYNLVDTIIRQTDRVNSSADKTKNPDNLVNGTRSFQEILNEQFNKRVSFSKHANQRVETRNIRISESDLNRLDNALMSFSNEVKSLLAYLLRKTSCKKLSFIS
jgi:hypothetical protein